MESATKQVVVLHTELVKIYDLGTHYQMLITMSQGGIVEHEPFPKSLEGLVTALQTATEICAGKFFLRRLVQEKSNKPKIETQKLIGTKN